MKMFKLLTVIYIIQAYQNATYSSYGSRKLKGHNCGIVVQPTKQTNNMIKPKDYGKMRIKG